MNHKLRAFTISAILTAAPLALPASAQVNLHIGIPFPPLPHVVFESQPQVVVVPNTNVYYAPGVSEYDTYRVGPYWYLNRGGYWYRAHGHHQQFRPVSYNSVPSQLGGLPSEYRRYPMQPEPYDGGDHWNQQSSGHRKRSDSRHQGKHHQHD